MTKTLWKSLTDTSIDVFTAFPDKPEMSLDW